jgi:hypothetical protein
MSDYTAPQFCPECDNPTSLCMCDFSPPKRDPRKENKMNKQKTFEELRDAAAESLYPEEIYDNSRFKEGADWCKELNFKNCTATARQKNTRRDEALVKNGLGTSEFELLAFEVGRKLTLEECWQRMDALNDDKYKAEAEARHLRYDNERIKLQVDDVLKERDEARAQCERMAAVILTAMQVLDIDRQDFDGLRVQEFKSFNVHELDTTFTELKEALSEYRNSVGK